MYYLSILVFINKYVWEYNKELHDIKQIWL